MRARPALLVLVLCLAAVGCDSNNDAPDRDAPEADGLAYAQSDQDVDATFGALDAALEAAPAVTVVARRDHAARAQNIGLELRPTRVIFFGNPALGTPLMQENQEAGLDLPQKMLVYENEEGVAYASYNTTDYLAARHDVGNASTLGNIGAALETFATGATGADEVEQRSADVDEGQGVIRVESGFGVGTTFQRLRSAVEDAGPLSVLFELNHRQNAQSVNLDLRPTRLLVFGNAQLGTPLMQDEQSIGIDLPQKMLVYEDAGGAVHIAYNDPFYLAERHDLDVDDEQQERLDQISDALAGLAAQAAGADE